LIKGAHTRKWLLSQTVWGYSLKLPGGVNPRAIIVMEEIKESLANLVPESD